MTNRRSLFSALFLLSCLLSGAGHGHTGHGLAAHQQEDAYLAAQARARESGAAESVRRYLDASLAAIPVRAWVSELVDAVTVAKANAAVGGNPALYGAWGPLTAWPFAFASAANLPDGRILAWGGNNPRSFNGGTYTYAAIWNPATGQFTNANHDTHSLFCGVPVMLEDGRVFVAGGDTSNASASARRTSTFNYKTQSWTRIQDMAVGRWYNGAVALPNGQVFSALGEPGSAVPELWSPGTGWAYLNGINLQAGVLDQATWTEPKNWLPHLHLAPNGKVFHSGHTPQMHYLDPTGNGGLAAAGLNNDWNTANTPGVLYDEGKLLQGGGTLYDAANTSTAQSAVIDINSAAPTRTPNANMLFPRIFHNQVVLPNGEVMVVGGNSSGLKFSDVGSQMTPELWSPASRTWRPLADMAVPRNYHGVALLLADGRVWAGGGGLCNCAADHPDAQVFSPPYLYNADGTPAARPEIISAPGVVSYGRTITVAASPGITKFSLVRMSATTHALNSDLRFLNVPFTAAAGGYQLNLHTNPNVMVPGYWMLFALNAQGVPSVAKVIQVSTSGVPTLANPGDQSTAANTNVALALAANDPNGDPLTFSALALPPGLAINPATGAITGIPTVSGSSRVVVSVTDGTNVATVSFVWNILGGQLPTASAVFGGAGGVAFTDLVADGQGLTGITVRAGWWLDSIQGLTNTGPLPLHGGIGGNPVAVTWPAGEYLVRSYGLYGTYVGQISFVTNTGRVLGPYGTGQGGNNVASFDYTVPQGQEIVGFTGRASAYLDAIGIVSRPRAASANNQPPVVTAIANQSHNLGELVSLAVAASDPNGDGLTYSAVGLPPGLTIASGTGLISGKPSAAGAYDTIVRVQDSNGAAAEVNFVWTVSTPALAFNPITTAPGLVNTAINVTASVSNGSNPQFKWSFGDNSPETAYSATAAASHTYATPGLYVVRVTAKDSNNITSTATFIQAVHLPHTANRPALSSNMAVANNRLWVVNQDNDSVSAFNSATHAKLAEIPVGKSPRALAVAPDGRIWVSNKAAATLSVIDPATLKVQQTVSLAPASQPFGLAFAPDGSAAYVVLEATGTVLKLNPSTGATAASLAVGPNPRHLAVTADGGRLLVSRYITPPVPGESTAAVQAAGRGGEVVVVNTAGAMAIDRTVLLRHSDKQDDTNQGAGIPNYLAMAAVSPDGQSAWVPSKQDNIKRGTLRNGNNLNFQNSVRGISSKINLATLAETYGARLDFDNSGVASAAVFDRSGNYLFVALEASREVAVVDAYAGIELSRVQVGRAPDGLAVSADGQTLYVNNFMDRTVSVVDLSGLLARGDWLAPVRATLAAVAVDKLAAPVLAGKQLFYDASDLRLASDAYLSCAACHNDGGHDGRVWDLTGFGEGLRNTVDLRGRAGVGHGLLHWSGNFDEIQDFEGQIRALAGGTGLMADADFAATKDTLGARKAGKSADLDRLAAYVASLDTFAGSPYRNADGSLTAAAAAGQALFGSAGCGQCHGGAPYTDSPSGAVHDVGTLKAGSGKRLGAALAGLDTPTLRDAWNTAPYLHDGSAPTLDAAIAAHTNVALAPADIAKVAAFVREIGGSEPAPANLLPSVALTAPTNNSTYAQGTQIILIADASDRDGSILKVEFYADNILLSTSTAAPYSYIWSGAAVGSHTLFAKAYDNTGGVTTSSTVSVSITAANVPTASPIYGGAGGTVFTDNITASQSLTGIEIRSGWWLDSIKGILNTGTLLSHGGTGGNLATVTWPAGEYLVRSYGLYGTYVGQISFVTNTGRVLGPYGTGQGGMNTTSFDYSVPAGHEIVGFTGRASNYLNAIGFLHQPRQSINRPPVIATVTNQVQTIGNAVSLNISAADPDGDTLTYSATSLPPGLAINATTGLVTGSLTAIGSFNVTVTVQDTKGAASVANFSWVVNAVSTVPVISPLFGSAGGTVFIDSILANQSLTGIEVRNGWWLDSIKGILNTGTLLPHGGTGGNLATVTWPTGEYLVRIYGLYGTYVGQISFVTNTGRILGPYGAGLGGSGSSSFDYTVPAGNEIVGFTGRSSGFLNAIGVISRVRQ